MNNSSKTIFFISCAFTVVLFLKHFLCIIFFNHFFRTFINFTISDSVNKMYVKTFLHYLQSNQTCPSLSDHSIHHCYTYIYFILSLNKLTCVCCNSTTADMDQIKLLSFILSCLDMLWINFKTFLQWLLCVLLLTIHKECRDRYCILIFSIFFLALLVCFKCKVWV